MKISKNPNNLRLVYLFSIIILIIILVFIDSYGFNKRDKSKIIVLGIDAATWNVIDPLIKEGKLPNFKFLKEHSVYGYMEVFGPAQSPKIWTSIATGKMPEKHGISNFKTKFEGYGPGYVASTSNLRNTKAIWNIMSQYNKSAGVFLWLVTWPAEKVNGYIITNEALSDLDYTSYPKNIGYNISYYIEKRVPMLKQYVMADDIYPKELDDDEFLSFSRDLLTESQPLSWDFNNLLYKKYNPDLMLFYDAGIIDATGHIFWRYYEPEKFDDVPEHMIEKYGNALPNVYSNADKKIGELLSNIDDNTYLIVLSDHGMHANTLIGNTELEFVGLNDIFKELGILKFKETGEIDWDYTLAYDCANNDWDWVKRVCLHQPNKNNSTDIILRKVIDNFDLIDIKEINKSLLKNFTIIDDKSFFLNLDKNAINRNIIVNEKIINFSIFLEKSITSGVHGEEKGIFAIFGPGIKENIKLMNVTPYDIVPTILYIFNMPQARDMDGKILEVFKGGLRNKIDYIDTYDDEEFLNNRSKFYLSEDPLDRILNALSIKE